MFLKLVLLFENDLMRKMNANGLLKELNGNAPPSESWRNESDRLKDFVLNPRKASGIVRKRNDLPSESEGKNLQIVIRKTMIEDVVNDPLNESEGSAQLNANQVAGL